MVAGEVSADRLAGLWLVLGIIGLANVLMIVVSAPATNVQSFSPLKYSLSVDGVKIHPWRLLTGAIAFQSVVSLAVGLGVTWWLGRFLCPRLRFARFVVLCVASLSLGALVTLLATPTGGAFGGLSLSAGLFGAQLAGQRRGTIGTVQIPRLRNVGFVGLFIGWFVFSSLLGGLASFGSLLGGGIAGGVLGWLMFQRTGGLPGQKTSGETRHVIIGTVVAVACFAMAFGLAQRDGHSTLQTTELGASSGLDILSELQARTVPMPTAPNEFRIAIMEDKTDIGDIQTYLLTCGANPTAEGEALIADQDLQFAAKRACQWIEDHAQLLTNLPKESCDGGLVARIQVTGHLADGRRVQGTFETREKLESPDFSQESCGSELSLSAQKGLGA